MEGGKRMKGRRFTALVSILLCTFLSLNPSLRELAAFPEHLNTDSQLPSLTGIWSTLIQRETIPDATPAVSNVTKEYVSYKLFGIFPLKTGEIEKRPELRLIPGGQSIGVTLQVKGVMVVGQAPVTGTDGKKTVPAKEVGIEIGDTLLKIDGKEVHSDREVANAVHNGGEKQGFVLVDYRHQGQIMEKRVGTVFCADTGRYRIGLYVRDEADGVGTLTFIDPMSKRYGALGHVINDADTNQRIEVSSGQVVASTIYSIEKGTRGHPGEKVGTFVNDSSFSGTIEKNSGSGIFGTLHGSVDNSYFQDAIPVGWESEIVEGPAKIYTVLKGTKIEEFDVHIDRILTNRTDSKNMIISVTDPRLIEVTGGIIQGMSGSPIIQNGKIIGAITHVCVVTKKHTRTQLKSQPDLQLSPRIRHAFVHLIYS